jgi:hypothetical protein
MSNHCDDREEHGYHFRGGTFYPWDDTPGNDTGVVDHLFWCDEAREQFYRDRAAHEGRNDEQHD